MEYNGFKNKATWLVNLWLTNTEVAVTYWSKVAHIEAKHHGFVVATQNVADRMEDVFQGMACDAVESRPMLLDILQSALADVDWDHIAQNLMEGVPLDG